MTVLESENCLVLGGFFTWLFFSGFFFFILIFFFIRERVKLICTSETETNTFVVQHKKAFREDVTLKTAIIKRRTSHHPVPHLTGRIRN